MNPDSTRKDRSLDKTEPMPAFVEPPLSVPPLPHATNADLGELEARTKEGELLHHELAETKSVLAALRSDLVAEKADHANEARTLRAVADRAQEEMKVLSLALKNERLACKQLKAQNLSFQHLLNEWGVPVEVGAGSASQLRALESASARFFPRLTPLALAADPVLPVLRGELSTFCFPDVLLFISNANLQGVLTVVADRVVSKIFLEKGCLEYAGWNNRDPELRLARLLEEAELVPPETLRAASDQCQFDFQLAARLLEECGVAAATIRTGLREHARVILGYLFHLRSGSFTFQSGKIERHKDLEFRLSVTDLLLKTAAEVDEKTRQIATAT